jgi:tRNA(Ile)-lysidine synthetase-like protein
MDVVDRERAGDSLTLRNWRPGDSYTPAGRSGATKIKTLFQETRIPLWERRRWPVIARGNQIVWTRRFGVAEEFSAGPHSAQGFVIRERTSESGESNVPLRTSTKVSGTFHRASTELDARRPGEPNAEVL